MSLSTFFHGIADFFHSDKAKHAFDAVSKIVPVALPIVVGIAAMTPNRSDDEIVKAFEQYGVPFVNAGAAGDPSTALLALATQVVAQKVPDGTAKSLIQTAIQIALVGSKAS